MAMTYRQPYGNMSTIRCTNCSAEIDMMRAGDHICRSDSPNVQPMDRINDAYSSMKSNPNIPHPFQPRPPPTRIDPGVANRPFLSSPLTPHGGQRTPTNPPNPPNPPRSPFRPPPRSATSPYPHPRPRSPSPELQLPQECAFPTFPVPEKKKNSKASRKAPDRSETDPTPHTLGLPPGLKPVEKEDQRSVRSARSVSRPTSPRSRSAGSDSVRKGSFSSTRSRPEELFDPNALPPMPSLFDRKNTPSPASQEAPRLPFVESPNETQDMPPGGPFDFAEQNEAMISEPPRSLGHFRKPSMSAATRPLHEIGSAKMHRPTLSRGASPAMLEPDFGQPRSASVTSNRSDVRLFDAPPVPGMSAQIEDAGNPYRQHPNPWAQRKDNDSLGPVGAYNGHGQNANITSHSPSESVSSDGSAVQTHSSRSSPPTSALSIDPSKNPYAVGATKYPGAPSYNRAFPHDDPPMSPPRSPSPSNDRTEMPTPLSPRRNQNQFPPRGQSRNPPPVHLYAPESPQHPQFPPSDIRQPQLPQPDAYEPQSPPSESRQPSLPQLDSDESQYPPPDSRQPQLPQLDMTQPSALPQGQAPPSNLTSDMPPPRRRPTKSFSRPNFSRPVGVVEPESPMDPAMQGNYLAPNDTSDKYPPPRPPNFRQGPPHSPNSAPPIEDGGDYFGLPRSSTPASPNRQGSPFMAPPRSPAGTPPPRGSSRTPPARMSPAGTPMNGLPPRGSSRTPPAPSSAFPPGQPRPPPPAPPLRRATTGTKGNCRGCGEGIKGKSVSSADGRLTGRWHKTCFACKTCQQPFPSNDFYVFGNHPYCSRHYHQLNRTLCVNCDRGIEGQYVETDRHLKFHPHCFTCKECHLILRDNYYEDPQTGKILCEKHAFNEPPGRLGVPGARRFPERRTTRLMMMS